jgi:hypothetical protein
MALFTNQVNPVGVAHDVLNPKLEELKQIWSASTPNQHWWQNEHFIAAVSFLFNSLDIFVKSVSQDEEVVTGADKKATVLYVLNLLYDHVLRPALPLWLRPFARKIKVIIINVVASYMIDFIVQKYNEGLWRHDEEEATKEEPKNEDSTVPPATV